jgi:hypothetical protein
MKVPAGGETRYEAAEQHARKVHQASVENGTMLGWELYRIHNQDGESEYNYVTVDVFEDFASSQAGFSEEMVREVLGKETDKIMEEIMASRELLYRENLSYHMGVPGNNEEEKFLIVNYMKAQNPESHLEMEKTAFMPLHKMAIENKEMTSWSVWTPNVVDGKPEYTALVVDGFSSMEKLENRNYDQFFNEFMKDKSQEEKEKTQSYYDNVIEIREHLKSQVWEKISSTTPKKM